MTVKERKIDNSIENLKQVLLFRKEEVGDLHNIMEDEIILTIENMIQVLEHYKREG